MQMTCVYNNADVGRGVYVRQVETHEHERRGVNVYAYEMTR